MEIRLNFREDAELREEIRGLIRTQVKNLVREEIRQIASETLKQKFDVITAATVEKMFKTEISENVKSHLGINSWNNNFVRDEAKREIAAIVTELFKKGAVH